MSNYTKSFKFETDFDGDHVVVCMNRMKRKDALALAPYMKDSKDGEDVVLSFSDQMELMDTAAEILPDLVVSIRGLFIEGTEVSKESECFSDIFEGIYFMELVSNLIGALLQHSFLTKVQKGVVKKPADEGMEASEPTKDSVSEG